MTTETLKHTVENFDYLHHGARTLAMRLFRPVAPGPHPVMVDLHGGAWNKGSLEECQARGEALADAGIASAALDFRQGSDRYPSSLIDINYAIRWLKAKAHDLDLDPTRVAVSGQSSGGHLSMLVAMRPHDKRYASVALPAGSPDVDASVVCVGMLWPVINPISRYRHALRARAAGDPQSWVGDIPERHDTYWVTQDAMIEGNPMLALERGEAVETPPAIWIQGRPDVVHDYRDPDSPLDMNEPGRFAKNYRQAGGEIDIVTIDQGTRAEASVAPLVSFMKSKL